MRFPVRLTVLATAVLFAMQAFLLASSAVATPNTKLDLVNDCGGFGPGGACDMAGPTAGFLNYNQDDTDNLRVVVSMKDGKPNTTYEIWLVCGPTHASACGFITIGTLTTNVQGNGTASLSVDLATLQAAPFGSGDRTDHVDLGQGVGDLSAGFFAASVLAYTIP